MKLSERQLCLFLAQKFVLLCAPCTLAELLVPRGTHILPKDLWHDFLNYLGNDEWTINVPVSYGLSTTVFLATVLFYSILDYTRKPKFLTDYEIQKRFLSTTYLKRAFGQTIFNLIFGNGSVIILMGWLGPLLGCSKVSELPTVHRFLADYSMSSLVSEYVFYYSHRLLHHPWMYKRFHKQHHDWTKPIALASIDADLFDHILSNLTTIVVGPLLLRSHITVFWASAIQSILISVSAHSGYHFPWFPFEDMHDYHHSLFNVNYGTQLELLDVIHGTKYFKKTDKYNQMDRNNN